MSLAHIRELYDVPAHAGRPVIVRAPGASPRPATITGSSGRYLYVRFEGDQKPHPGMIPVDHVTFPDPDPEPTSS